MAWPDVEKLVRVLDISRWVGDGENTPLIDFQKLAEMNPSVKGIITRMAVGDYYVDPAFEYNYRKGRKAGFKMGIYYPLNPSSSLADSKEFFRNTLGDRQPKVIVPDCELRGGETPAAIRAYIKDFMRWLRDSFSFAHILNYTAAWFWNPIFSGSWGPEFDLWTAYYPLWWKNPNGENRQAKSFEEVEAHLPLVDTEDYSLPVVPAAWYDTPDKVVAWQFSGKGELPPITGPRPKAKETDLNFWKKEYFERVFGPIEPEEPEKTLVKLEYDPDKVRLVINGETK